MNPVIKRLGLILGLLFITFAIGWALYSVFKKNNTISQGGIKPGTKPGQTTTGALPGSGTRTPGSGGTEEGTTSSTLPTANVITTSVNQNYYRPQTVTKLTNDNALFTSVNKGGSLRYHNASDGKFYSIGSDGQLRSLSDQTFYNVQNVVWAKTANKAVIEYPDGSKIVYNFDTKKQTTLPKHWEDFTFSPDSNQLAAKSMGLAPENRWLITTKDDGTDTQLIEPLGENGDKVTMDWSPSRQTVAFSQTGEAQGADRREVLLVGLKGENLKSIIVEGLDFASQWSPTGQKLLYNVDSSRSDFKPELWIVNSYGDTVGSGRQMLNVNTWASKCTFADDSTVFCGVPRELPQGAGMSPSIASDIPDDLFRIDLKTGIRTPIKLDQDYTIDSISYSAADRKIIFTDHHQTGAFSVSQ
jgi:hypothetical protein